MWLEIEPVWLDLGLPPFPSTYCAGQMPGVDEDGFLDDGWRVLDSASNGSARRIARALAGGRKSLAEAAGRCRRRRPVTTCSVGARRRGRVILGLAAERLRCEVAGFNDLDRAENSD